MSTFRFAKPLRRRLASLLMLALLFVQLATAAYACTLPAAGQGTEAANGVEAMSGCTEDMALPKSMVDADQPGLCVQHCNPGASAFFDSGNASTQLPPIVLSFLYVAAASLLAIPVTRGRYSDAPKSERAGSPPLSVLNCCYRI